MAKVKVHLEIMKMSKPNSTTSKLVFPTCKHCLSSVRSACSEPVLRVGMPLIWLRTTTGSLRWLRSLPGCTRRHWPPIWGKEVIARNDAKARDARERFAKTGEYLSTQIFTNTPDIEGFMLGAAEYFLIRLAASRFESGKMRFSGVHGMAGLTCMTLLAKLLKSESLF